MTKSKNKLKGVCLCGAVKLIASSASTSVGVCHCSMCRKWAAGPMFGVDCGDDVSISGGQFVTVYRSSDWAERGFCAKCGTHLFYRLLQNGQHIVSPDLFDDQHLSLHFDHQIFIDEKPAYYAFANETKNMTGEEVIAQFLQEQ